jgi:threonine/homoserine/homoserine lactone efflux protein
MFGTHDFLLFVIAGLLLNATPGPDMLYIVARSTTQGRRAGCAAALGIGAGCLVHIAAAAIGLSALLAASAAAFSILKFCGAAYLIYIGISLLRSSPRYDTAAAVAPAAILTVFAQGFLTNALNPKVALFFLAFVPQFIDADAPHKALAFLFLGAVFNCNGTLWNLGVAWIAARAAATWQSSQLAVRVNRCIGALLILLGIRLALTK